MRAYWERMESKMTRAAYRAEHLQNANLLPARADLLKCLPQGGVVAELGVNKGDFSNEIIQLCSPRKLHLVDIWGSERYHEGLRKSVEQRFQSRINEGSVQIHVGLSTAVADEFPDNYFDWVYIDTDHSYQTTLEELRLYAPKVRKGGFIAGHDYITGNWNGMVRYGVKEAVTLFCVEQNYELVYLTMETWFNPSFAIRKIH